MERDGAVGGGVHLLSSSWLERESWQWYKAAEPLCVFIQDRFRLDPAANKR